jgi:hypothetical protein
MWFATLLVPPFASDGLGRGLRIRGVLPTSPVRWDSPPAGDAPARWPRAERVSVTSPSDSAERTPIPTLSFTVGSVRIRFCAAFERAQKLLVPSEAPGPAITGLPRGGELRRPSGEPGDAGGPRGSYRTGAGEGRPSRLF